MSQEMGFMDILYDKNVANSTKCQTWQDVLEAHTVKEEDVSFKFSELAGMLTLLVTGLSLALFIFLLENGMHFYLDSGRLLN